MALSLLKILNQPWETARGFLREDLETLEYFLNTQWARVFGANNVLQSSAISGDSSAATRYVANTGPANAPEWSQVDLSNGVKSRLPYAKLASVSGASKLLGRGASGSGDVQEVTVGSGLTMTGTTLSADIPPASDPQWSVLTNGDVVTPELIFAGGDVIMLETL